MATVSLCMIVKNEEKVLKRCLDSVKDVVDEIIIVDTGSTDKTKAIAAQFTEKIYDFAWVDDFSAARNFAFSKASMDFQMWLDADDLIGKNDREAMLALKLDPRLLSYDMVMMKYNVAFDKGGKPTLVYNRERWMKRSAGYKWKGAIHEAIAPVGRVLYADIAITHAKTDFTQTDRNLRIFEKMLRDGEEFDARSRFYYARELMYHDRLEDAVREFGLFLDDENGWVENKISACIDISRCCDRLGATKLVLLFLFRSFEYDSPRAEVCCEIAAYHMQLGQVQQAIYWYKAALGIEPNPNGGGFVSPDCYAFVPYLQLCVCYDKLGDRQSAELYNNKAKELKPDDKAVLYNERYFSSL